MKDDWEGQGKGGRGRGCYVGAGEGDLPLGRRPDSRWKEWEKM